MAGAACVQRRKCAVAKIVEDARVGTVHRTTNRGLILTEERGIAAVSAHKVTQLQRVIGKTKRYQWVTLAVYAMVIAVVMCFHEPWFDEAQSWLIARDSSWKDILLFRPHYEGHPPLWWVLLAVPAKLGVPYEIGLKSVQFICSMLMAGALIFYSPFSKIITIPLPFTYFFCYQYGVTARPYALLCLAMFLVAMHWRIRNEHPWRTVWFLVLLCLTSTYGVVISGTMAAIWVLRVIFSGESPFHNRRRFAAWSLLMAVGIVLALDVWPAADNFATQPSTVGTITSLSLFRQFAMFWLVLPSETMFTDFAADTALKSINISLWGWVMCMAISLLMWAIMLRIAHRRGNALLLLSPYAALSVTAMRYFSGHHIGVLLAFFIAMLWLNLLDRPLEPEDIPAFLRKHTQNIWHIEAGKRRLAKSIATIVLLGMSLIWNVQAIASDIRYEYTGSRALAAFIKDNHLENARWVSFWRYLPEEKYPDGSVREESDDTHRVDWTLVTANPYFSKNLISCAYKDYTFVSNEAPPQSQADKEIEACAAQGAPEFLIGSRQPRYFMKRLGLSYEDYTYYELTWLDTPWKGQNKYSTIGFYVRNDVYARLFVDPNQE